MAFFAIAFLYGSLSYSLLHYHEDRPQSICLILCTLALVGIAVYNLSKGLMHKIIVSKENIIITYFLTKRRLIINHTDVIAIYDKVSKSGSNGRNFVCNEQELELKDGTSISFTDEEFANYSELKSALWEYRLLAYADLREKEAQ